MNNRVAITPAATGTWPFGVDRDIDGPERRRSMQMLDEVFDQLVRTLEPEVFVEGGAFDAQVSVRWARDLPQCSVVAYEANPHVHRHFASSQDFAAMGVRYLHAALTDSSGMVPFHLIRQESASPYEGYHSLLRRTGNDWLGDVQYDCISVPGRCLDEDFKGSEGAAALWLDVEGAAGAVLAGAQDFLNHCSVAKVEVEEFAFWHDQWLGPAVVEEMVRHGLVPVARDFQHDEQFNVVFANPAELGADDLFGALGTLRQQEAAPEMLAPTMRLGTS